MTKGQRYRWLKSTLLIFMRADMLDFTIWIDWSDSIFLFFLNLPHRCFLCFTIKTKLFTSYTHMTWVNQCVFASSYFLRFLPQDCLLFYVYICVALDLFTLPHIPPGSPGRARQDGSPSCVTSDSRDINVPFSPALQEGEENPPLPPPVSMDPLSGRGMQRLGGKSFIN